MASITYGLIGSAINPSATTETEWIVCPTNHEYIGIVRVTNIDSVPVTFRLAHTDVSGAAASEDWIAYDSSLEIGDFVDITVEMAAAETLRVYASTANVAFKYSGQDKDNS